MSKHVLYVLLVVPFLWMCTGQNTTSDSTAEGETSTTEEVADENWQGEKFEYSETQNVSDVIDALAEQDSVPAVVKATVQEVCQAKGCWMNVADGGEGQPIFVQFKDYGFFMPKDLGGGEVVMKGYAYREMTSVEDLRHFAEDEGKSPEEIAAITEPEEELKFLASGVHILK